MTARRPLWAKRLLWSLSQVDEKCYRFGPTRLGAALRRVGDRNPLLTSALRVLLEHSCEPIMLPDAERFHLLNGPYLLPKCKIGGWLMCRLRGRVKVACLSNAPIQWPMMRPPTGGPPRMILCGSLVKAVQQESTIAI